MAVKNVEKYTPKANVWQTLPNLQVARASASGCILSDHLYVFGGTSAPDQACLSTIERLNVKLCISRSDI